MNIYFLGVRGNSLEDTYSIIVDVLKEQGHKIYADWLNTSEEQDALNFQDSYKRNLNSIKNCDIVVAETSLVSSGLGFQIATALNEKKPVLALYSKQQGHKPSATLRGSSDKNRLLTYKEYTDTSEIKSLIDDYIVNAKQSLDTKFILIISPEIDRYLEWASENRRMHKAQIVRNAIEDIMDKDKEYQEYLNN